MALIGDFKMCRLNTNNFWKVNSDQIHAIYCHCTIITRPVSSVIWTGYIRSKPFGYVLNSEFNRRSLLTFPLIIANMLKFFVVTFLALHCHCQRLIEVRDDKVIRSSDPSLLAVKSVSGHHSNIGGLRSVAALPVSSYMSGLHSLNYGLDVNGMRMGQLNSLRDARLNIAPTVYSSVLRPNTLAIRQGSVQSYGIGLARPAYQTVHVDQPAIQAYALERPAIRSYGLVQPSLALARQVHIAQPQVSLVAQPQVHIAQPQVSLLARHQLLSTEAIRPVSAAIQQVGRSVEYRDVPNHESPIQAQDIIVESSDQPLNIHFKSRSSTVRLFQQHQAGQPGTIEQTSSQDEPSKVIHEVVKPVIQEVREVIQPYRQVTQEVQPVIENVHRIISKGEPIRQQYVADQQIVRQDAVHNVRQVQPVSFAVAQQDIRMVQPNAYVQREVSVARPALSVAHQSYAVAQPELQSVSYQSVQPIVSSIVRRPLIQNIGQNIHGYQTVLAEQSPLSIQQEIREPEIQQFVVQDLSQDLNQGLRLDLNQDLNQGLRQDLNQGLRQDLSQDLNQDLRRQMRQNLRQDLRQDLSRDQRKHQVHSYVDFATKN